MSARAYPIDMDALRALVAARIPHAELKHGDSSDLLRDTHESSFVISLSLSQGMRVDDYVVSLGQAHVESAVRLIVRQMEGALLEELSVPIRERTARLERELSAMQDRARRAERERDEAHATIRALTKGH